MELQYFGGNCLRLTSKKSSLTIDDNLKELGAKTITKPDEIALFTSGNFKEVPAARLVLAEPGQYEVSDFSIQGVAARSHIDEADKPKSGVMFKIIADDVKVVVVGHIYPELSDKQLEELGAADVLVLPVGGAGYTLDATGALEIIKKIEPKIVIPTHFGDKNLKYPVPQADLTEVLKNLAMEPSQTLPKLKVKPQELLENTQLIILEHQ